MINFITRFYDYIVIGLLILDFLRVFIRWIISKRKNGKDVISIIQALIPLFLEEKEKGEKEEK